MFDVLLDQPKKRYYLLIALMVVCILMSMIFDIRFGMDVVKAGGFNELMDLLVYHPNSFYGYFFYTLVTSPALYSMNVFVIVLQVIYGFIVSFNVFDWITLISMVGLIISHHNKMSRLTLGIQSGYLVVRCLMIMLMVLFIYPVFIGNNATAILSRIHLVSIVLVSVHIILFIVLTVYLISIIKLFYLPEFKKADD